MRGFFVFEASSVPWLKMRYVMETRRALSSDREEVLPLFQAYRAYFAGGTPTGSREFLTERLIRQDSVILLDDASPSRGFIQLYPLFSSWYATRIWFLSDLFVAQAARGQGIARALVAAAETFARAESSRSIMVEIPHSEPHLVTFYERAGYERDRTFDLYRRYLAS